MIIKNILKTTQVRVMVLGFSFLAALTQLSLQNCSEEKDALATFNGGKVYKWELDAHLSTANTSKMNPDELKEFKRTMVKRIAFVKMGALEAEKLGMEKTDDYKKRSLMLEEKAQINAYEVYLKSKRSSLIFDMMDIQQIFLKEKKDTNTKIASRKKEAEEIAQKLNEGKMSETEIENFISENTEEPFYQATAGHDFLVCMNCSTNRKLELTKPIQNSPVNKFIVIEKEGVGVWVSRKLSESNIEENKLKEHLLDNYKKLNAIAVKNLSKIKDEKNRSIVSSQLQVKENELSLKVEEEAKRYIKIEKDRSPLESKIESWKSKNNFKVYNDIPMHGQTPLKAEDIKENMLIYSVNDKNFTYGDLNKKYPASFYGVTEQLKTISSLIQYEALKDDPEFIKIKDSDDYKTAYNAGRERALAECYFYSKHKQSENTNLKDTPKDTLPEKYNFKMNF